MQRITRNVCHPELAKDLITAERFAVNAFVDGSADVIRSFASSG
jgi:hypothetical protein